MDQVITDAILDYQNNMKPYLDKQGLDTLAAEINSKFASIPATGQPESILTLDKNSIIRWNNLIGVLKYKGLLNSVDELPSVESANLGDIFGVKESSNEEEYQTLYVLVQRPLQDNDTIFQKQWMPIQSSESAILHNLVNSYNNFIESYNLKIKNLEDRIKALEL